MSTSPSTSIVAGSSSSLISGPYTEKELSLILLGEGHHIASPCADRYVDIPLVAELAADRIISAYDAEEYIDDFPSPEKDDLSVWICKMIRDAERDVPVVIAALARIDEYHLMNLEFKDCGIYDVDEACQLFLAAFLAAARSIFDKRNYLELWDRLVADGMYTEVELCLLERAFVEMMHDWRKRLPIDKDEDEVPTEIIAHPALETSGDEDPNVDDDIPASTVNEASLLGGLVAEDDWSQAIERRKSPRHTRSSWLSADKPIPFGLKERSSVSSTSNHVKSTAVSLPPSLGSVSSPLRVGESSNMDKDDRQRLVDALEAASLKLKQSARQRSPIYTRSSWLSQTKTPIS